MLEAICENPQAASPAYLADHLKIPLATVYRFIDGLTEEGFTTTGPLGNIIPGDRLRVMVLNSLMHEPRVTERRAVLRRLSVELDETVSLSVPQGTKLIYFDRVESHWPFQINLKTGDSLPLHRCASGKMYLSSFEPESALQVFKSVPAEKRTRNTIKSGKQFVAELAAIRKRDYALDNEEWFDDMVGAAVPIRNGHGELCACLSTHALITRKKLSKIEKQIPKMLTAARDLELLFFAQTPKVKAKQQTAKTKV
ncbi:MAG: IclR family transcriptional regulator [Hyphomicrobiaceae bacterium]